jgi:hypothetical protein
MATMATSIQKLEPARPSLLSRRTTLTVANHGERMDEDCTDDSACADRQRTQDRYSGSLHQLVGDADNPAPLRGLPWVTAKIQLSWNTTFFSTGSRPMCNLLVGKSGSG